MQVAVFSSWQPIGRTVEVAAVAIGASVTTCQDLGSFREALERDRETIGIVGSSAPLAVLSMLTNFRRGRVSNPLLVIGVDTPRPEHLLASMRAQILIAGADDAQHWPVDPMELGQRLRALERRRRIVDDSAVMLPDGHFDRTTGMVVGEPGSLQLTRTEALLFAAIVDRGEAPASRPYLMSVLYGGHERTDTKIIDVFVCKLRKKLAPFSGGREMIANEWGLGYRFTGGQHLPKRRASA